MKIRKSIKRRAMETEEDMSEMYHPGALDFSKRTIPT